MEIEIVFEDIPSKLKYWKIYKGWLRRKSGKDCVDNRQGAGYYLPIGVVCGAPLIGKIEEQAMESGKTMIKKLLSYENCRDPWDMTKSSDWQYIGYKGETPWAEMRWPEYLKLHTG